jgi:ribokinase
MNHRPHICVVGSSNVDLTFRTARLPRPGETMAGQAFHLGFGGKGANQAVMAARLGAQVTLVSKIGRDVFGEQSLQNYRTQGIETRHVRVDEQRSTGLAAILVDDQARNCIIVVPGANLGLTPEDVRDAAASIRTADVQLCQLEVPVATTLEALRVAKAAGVRTILNPAPATPLPDDMLPLVDLCVPNETELEALSGCPVADLVQVEAAARVLLGRGAGQVIVTLGDRGAMIVDAQSAEHIPAVPVTAVDSTGAGDAFIGSLAVFLAEQLPLTEAVRRANAVAALSVTRPGTQASFPVRAEVDAFTDEPRPSGSGPAAR